MTLRTLISVTTVVAGVICGCGCESQQAARVVRSSGEQWVLVGEYTTPRKKAGPPDENWLGIMHMDGTLEVLVDFPMTTPDGDRELSVTAAYSAPRGILICERYSNTDPMTADVYRHNLASGEKLWIAKGKWDNICGFTWSPDGSKVAFVASVHGGPLGFVVQYDLDRDRLEKLAGEAFGTEDGTSSIRPRRPVYSEDGKWLYFVGMDRHVTRVGVTTGQRDKLPFSDAIAVLTVRGETLVYARQVGPAKDYRFDIVAVSLADTDGGGGERVLDDGYGVIWQNYVSPSRRFILFRYRAGYSSTERLIDLDEGVCLDGERLLWQRDGFRPIGGTAWMGPP